MNPPQMNPPAPRRRRDLDAIDGVLLLDKDAGESSNGALQSARHLLEARKAGHTGTLDPLASGLLPLTFGEATKFSADLLEADKAYEATLALGVRTSTGDEEGEVLSRTGPSCTRGDFEQVLARFVGEIDQVPPMHSALKRDGRPLYEYARAGIELERPARRVRVHAVRLLAWDPLLPRIEVECGKGTYIRTLAQDIGEALGCGASLAALRRTRVGPTELSGSVTLAQLRAMTLEGRRGCLMAVDALLEGLPQVRLEPGDELRFGHGQPVSHRGGAAARVRVYGAEGRLLGVGRCEAGRLLPQRLVGTPAPAPGREMNRTPAPQAGKEP
jgi:tRNA pseudouridine55 synthase